MDGAQGSASPLGKRKRPEDDDGECANETKSEDGLFIPDTGEALKHEEAKDSIDKDDAAKEDDEDGEADDDDDEDDENYVDEENSAEKYDESVEEYPKHPAFDHRPYPDQSRSYWHRQINHGDCGGESCDSTHVQNFQTKATELQNIPRPQPPKIALMGDTGAGKSSLLNSVVDIPDLARAVRVHPQHYQIHVTNVT